MNLSNNNENFRVFNFEFQLDCDNGDVFIISKKTPVSLRVDRIDISTWDGDKVHKFVTGKLSDKFKDRYQELLLLDLAQCTTEKEQTELKLIERLINDK